jgi:hypothetical protein
MTTKYLVIKDAHINDFNKVDDIIETKVEAVIQLSGYERGSEALKQAVLDKTVQHLVECGLFRRNPERFKTDPQYRVDEGYWDDPYMATIELATVYGKEIEVLEVL